MELNKVVREYRGECCESVFRDNSMDGMYRWCRIDCEYKMSTVFWKISVANMGCE